MDEHELKALITSLGGYAAVAERLGLSRQAVYKWTRVPKKRAYTLAEITRRPITDFRPDLKSDD